LRRPPAPSPGVSWRSGDSSPIGIGRTWVPPDPLGVLTPSGFTPVRACDQPKPIAAPRALSRPFRGPSPQPRTEPHDPWGRRPMLPLLSFLALRHDLRTVDPLWATDPSVTPCHVRGLATPFAASTTVPTGARSAGAPMGFSLRGFTPSRRCPFRGLCPPGVFAARPPAEAGRRLPTPSGPCSRDVAGIRPLRARSANLLGILPSRVFPPVVRALALFRDADPHTLRRVHVSSHLGLRALRNDGIGLSLSGLPALVGFRTFRPSRRSVHHRGGRAHGFASRGSALTRTPTL